MGGTFSSTNQAPATNSVQAILSRTRAKPKNTSVPKKTREEYLIAGNPNAGKKIIQINENGTETVIAIIDKRGQYIPQQGGKKSRSKGATRCRRSNRTRRSHN